MKKGDFIWGFILACIVLFLAVPQTRAVFEATTAAHPYLMAFVKFAILATMGEFLSLRIIKKEWITPAGVIWRAIIWGFLGMCIVLVFELFHAGSKAALDKGLLPGKSAGVVWAFFTSALMNIIFAPTMMVFHRISDTYINLVYKEKRSSNLSFKEVIEAVDWNSLISFAILKTVPFFWIPAHTIVFLLPAEFRIVTAAFLSIALGAILAFASNSGE